MRGKNTNQKNMPRRKSTFELAGRKIERLPLKDDLNFVSYFNDDGDLQKFILSSKDIEKLKRSKTPLKDLRTGKGDSAKPLYLLKKDNPYDILNKVSMEEAMYKIGEYIEKEEDAAQRIQQGDYEEKDLLFISGYDHSIWSKDADKPLTHPYRVAFYANDFNLEEVEKQIEKSPYFIKAERGPKEPIPYVSGHLLVTLKIPQDLHDKFHEFCKEKGKKGPLKEYSCTHMDFTQACVWGAKDENQDISNNWTIPEIHDLFELNQSNAVLREENDDDWELDSEKLDLFHQGYYPDDEKELADSNFIPYTLPGPQQNPLDPFDEVYDEEYYDMREDDDDWELDSEKLDLYGYYSEDDGDIDPYDDRLKY